MLSVSFLSFTKIFANYSKLELPDYHRMYDWGKPQWKELIDDLMNEDPGSQLFFRNRLILKKKNDGNACLLVDGYQLIVTNMLLLKALASKLGNTVDFLDCVDLGKDKDNQLLSDAYDYFQKFADSISKSTIEQKIDFITNIQSFLITMLDTVDDDRQVYDSISVYTPIDPKDFEQISAN